MKKEIIQKKTNGGKKEHREKKSVKGDKSFLREKKEWWKREKIARTRRAANRNRKEGCTEMPPRAKH
jgi:hypothetical protein